MNVRQAWHVLWHGTPPLPDIELVYETRYDSPSRMIVHTELIYPGVVYSYIDGEYYCAKNGKFEINQAVEVGSE